MTHRTFDEQIANFNRAVSSWDINQEYKVALLGMIASLGYEHEKSITPEPHWIPVTERLPDIGADVMFSVAKIYCAEGCLRSDGDWSQFRWDGIIPKDLVDAWMQLPEPFKGVTDGGD